MRARHVGMWATPATVVVEVDRVAEKVNGSVGEQEVRPAGMSAGKALFAFIADRTVEPNTRSAERVRRAEWPVPAGIAIPDPGSLTTRLVTFADQHGVRGAIADVEEARLTVRQGILFAEIHHAIVAGSGSVTGATYGHIV